MAAASAAAPAPAAAVATSPTQKEERFTLVFFAPTASADAVKEAVFATGAGSIGDYDRTSFTVAGVGMFTPGKNASPFIGAPGVEERVEEVRVQTQCQGRDMVRRAVEAIKRTHPYEEAVYEVYKLEDF